MSRISLKSIPSPAKPAPGTPRQRPEDRRRSDSDSEAQPLWPISSISSIPPAGLRSEGFAEDLPELLPQALMPRRSGALASLISLVLVGTALLPGR